jgi:lincosamide nucleotidyltransferase A/C/D/E
MPAEMPAGEVVAVLNAFEVHGIAVWIDGGWGVDALLGRQTRLHADLDIVLAVGDAATADRLLRGRGHGDVPCNDTCWWNYMLGDGRGHEVDFHLVTFDDEGNGIYGPPRDGGSYPACAFGAEGRIAGRPVRCLTLDCQLTSRSGYPLRERDRHDIAHLCRAFDRAPPPDCPAA